MNLEGITGSPYKHPNTRRTTPSAFQRPSISVGNRGARRAWREIPARDVKIGDVLPDVGEIAAVHEELRVPDDVSGSLVWTVTVTNVLGATFTFPGEHSVKAYTT